MDKKKFWEWFQAAGIRAIKTFAQTAASMFTVGQFIKDIDWIDVLSVALVAAIYSMATSIAGLPETKNSGTLELDTTDPSKIMYRLALNDKIECLTGQKKVTFIVDPNKDLSQE
jgi:hypothetical protein